MPWHGEHMQERSSDGTLKLNHMNYILVLINSCYEDWNIFESHCTDKN
jgi:hypothetical protein